MLIVISYIILFCYHAGRAVINAAEIGISFPLKRRDQMLDYVLTLMGRDESEELIDSSIEHLRTQVFYDFMIVNFFVGDYRSY